MHYTFLKIIALCIIFTSSEAIAQGRRRRRNLYNHRPCGPGTFAILSRGKTRVLECRNCANNTFRPDEKHSAENCLPCEAGRHSNEEKTYCVGYVCRAGTHGTIGSLICDDCEEGYYSDIGAFKCTACESGRYNTAPKQTTCLGEMCPSGKYGLNAQTSTTNLGLCHTCPAGKWSSTGASICTTCPDGKWSPENADHCQDHDKCHRGTYPGASKTSTSGDAKCERCIHYSNVYFAAYLYAATLSILIALIFLSNMRNTCYMLFFIICPGAWATTLVSCTSKPDDIPAIISLVMNTFITVPVFRYFHTSAKKWHHAHKEKIQEKTIHHTKNNTHNIIKPPDIKINITHDTNAVV